LNSERIYTISYMDIHKGSKPAENNNGTTPVIQPLIKIQNPEPRDNIRKYAISGSVQIESDCN
jgi:hypothetical protein